MKEDASGRRQRAVMATDAEWERIGRAAAESGMDLSRFVMDRAFVTDRAVKAERRVLASMRAGRGKGMALANGEMVEKRLEPSRLTRGQREAVRTVLLSNDLVIGVQGHAGSGKPTCGKRSTGRASRRWRSHCGAWAFATAPKTCAYSGARRSRGSSRPAVACCCGPPWRRRGRSRTPPEMKS